MSLPLVKEFGVELFVNGDHVCFPSECFVPAWRMRKTKKAEETNMEIRKRTVPMTFTASAFLAKAKVHEVTLDLYQAVPRREAVGSRDITLARLELSEETYTKSILDGAKAAAKERKAAAKSSGGRGGLAATAAPAATPSEAKTKFNKHLLS